jgi:predicted RecA/RadA family phage recombinase
MANNFKHSGERIRVVAAGARTSGNITADKLGSGASDTTIAGVALADAASGDAHWLATSGVWNLTVPASTAAGVKLYVPAAPPTAGGALVLTATSSSNTLFGKTLTAADASNKADVLVIPPTY